jgi:rare lipoprotein A
VAALLLLGAWTGQAQSQPAPLSRTPATATQSDAAVPLPRPAPRDGSAQIALAREAVAESATGLASWYGRRFHGRPTASGHPFDMAGLTAAHLTLPFGTRVRVTNLANGRSVVVTINDRGPYVKPRIIDLSRAAAERLGFLDDGVTKVRLDILAETSG